MDYVNNPIYPTYYYILLSPPNSFLLPPSLPLQALQGPAQINAENKRDDVRGNQKILVTKEDLLLQGYEQTKKAWSEQQDEVLLRLCADQKARFDQIAKLIPGRNAKMCYSRFRRLSNQSKEVWSKAENIKLGKLVEQLGENWKSIALNFPNRNHKQLKDHYQNYLRPNLTTRQWTLEEDLLLVQLLTHHGMEWQLFKKNLPHRSRNQIKNRIFGRILRIHNRKLEGLPC